MKSMANRQIWLSTNWPLIAISIECPIDHFGYFSWAQYVWDAVANPHSESFILISFQISLLSLMNDCYPLGLLQTERFDH